MRAGLVLLKQKPEITYNVPEYDREYSSIWSDQAIGTVMQDQN